VHAARLVSGEEVVVKVQRPQVAALVDADIAAMAWLAPRLVGRIPVSALANPPALVELFAETIVEELDFRLEAENMLDIARVLSETDQRAMVVPRPHPTLVTRRVLVMERLRGFAFDDVESMHAAGIDTSALLRAGLIASLEGALIHGVFHGDLHGGNLLVQSDGRTALLDFGITGRLDEPHRVAFLRLLVAGLAGDIRTQLIALRDLGAFPADTDLDAVISDLDLEGPVKDPTKMSSDELVAELSSLTKRLLDYGARAPKELMLFVKNLMFLNAATATLAPDLDLLAEIAHVHTYFVREHGARILAEVGVDPTRAALDLDAVKASFGIEPDVEGLTFQELQERRRLILRRMQQRRRH
jgi:ubiquinone biosynthesis protein